MIVDYREGLGFVLDPSPLSIEATKATPAYRIGFRRFVAKELPEEGFLLKEQPNAEAYTQMIGKLSAAAKRQGLVLSVSQHAREIVEEKREYAEERARAGAEIKNRDEKYESRFEEYARTVNAAFARPLRPQQMRDSFFMCAMGKAGNFSVPGSGKTASVLGVFGFLQAKGLTKRIIVISPRNAFESWRNEFRACFGGKLDLIEFNVQDDSFAKLPKDERKRRIKLDSGACNLILVNYEAAPAYVDELRDLAASSSLLVFDEVHRVKRINGKWAEAALNIAEVCDRTIALTGTPIPNTYLDIYNFLNILFPREYSSFFNFPFSMLRDPSEYEIAKINSKLQPFFCRTTKQDLGVPDANPDDIQTLYVDPRTEEVLEALKLRYRKNKLTLMLRILQLETEPSLLLKSLDTSEYAWLVSEDEESGEVDYVDYSEDIESMIKSAPSSIKLERCTNLAYRLHAEGKPVIVWCIFIETMNLLAEKMRQLDMVVAVIYGNTPQADRESILNSFRKGDIDVLITNPHTLAESVSLHSVCHDAIYYEYSFNLVHLLQSKDRIHRLGLPQDQYTQYYFLQDVYDNYNDGYSLDQNIYERLCEKESTMLNAISEQKLETMPASDEDLEAIFGDLFTS